GPSGASDAFTCVPVRGGEAYGERSFAVPAAQNWVQTGLFLREGETATVVDEGGEWSLGPVTVGEPIDHSDCVTGQLVARIGLHYKDELLTCVGGSATITAPRDGLLFVGMLPSNDLGETYETRRRATGARSVRVSVPEGVGATVPTVPTAEVAAFDYAAVSSGWVELAGAHVIATLPTATAIADRDGLAAALDRLDTIYELHEALRGAVPQHGQRLRFFPDGTQPGYMLAGNPIRMALGLVSLENEDRISRAGVPAEEAQVWGFTHEMGHDFTFVNGAWNYQEQSLEAWPNVFSVNALEQLGIALHPNLERCAEGPFPYGDWDPWEGLCFLLELREERGFAHYEAFFRALNELSPGQVPGFAPRWHFVHDLMEETSGADLTPRFEAWGVPRP
ncbi:MAG: M60 family metallopeptidase, partial [Myxococcota bacterium]